MARQIPTPSKIQRQHKTSKVGSDMRVPVRDRAASESLVLFLVAAEFSWS